MRNKIKASIVIPTFGTRPAYLTDVLNTAVKQEFPKDEYEILVVDNNPQPSVLPIVERFNCTNVEGPVVEYIKAPEIGLSEARNFGAQKARGEIVIYIGDDVLLSPGWLQAILSPFDDPTVACSGGKLIAKWEAPIPEWFSQLRHMALGMLDLGDKTLELTGQQVWGDNMAVRKSVLFKLGGFNPDIYGYGDRKYLWYGGDGECGLEKRIYEHQYKIVYEPRAWAYHRVPASRTTEEYFYRRTFVAAIGMSYGQIRDMRGSRFLYLRLLLQSALYFLKAGWLFLKARLVWHNRISLGTFANRYYGMAHHRLRVAVSKRLRNHIFRDSYLVERPNKTHSRCSGDP